jgi:hypothetical protein
MKTHPFSLLLALLTLFTTLASASEIEVPQWQPHDFSFNAKAAVTNPFLVPFSATVTAPDGKSFTQPGFFDGNGTWKIRVSANAEGKWSLVTKSDVKELDGQTAEFTCVKNTNANIHGMLRVDKDHPHHFIFEDGTHFFMQGYEYDFLWALDMDKPGVPTVEATLDLITKQGFNYVLLNAFAYDTGWRKGKSGPDDYGPPLLYAWEGDNKKPDHTHMNLAYWQHYDRVMTALSERGIQAHMFMRVFNKWVNWPKRGSDEEKLYISWLIARYAAYPNVIWDFEKEAQHEKELTYKKDWLKWIRENDPYHHLLTIHDDDKVNDTGAYDEQTDFRTSQQHSKFHETLLRQRERRAWPVANVESDYECGPGGEKDKTYMQAQLPDKMMGTLWEIAMAGGYTAYYYTYTAWDVIRPLDVPPGYALMKTFGDFWRSTEYWTLEPSDKLVSSGWCLANPGSEYIVYQKQPVPFTLDINGAQSSLQAEWFNPRTGKRTPAASLNNGVAKLTPPSDWGNDPLVLHLTK